jgi:large subunit ribosomal protein L13
MSTSKQASPAGKAARKTKTFVAKPAEVERAWYVVDAENQVVGRLATRLATILMGKHKPIYTPHVDCGDYIILVNAEKVHFTGQKWSQKQYRHHSGYIGGLKAESAERVLRRHPERIMEAAVRRMLPKNRLGKQMFKKLKVYAGPDHPHAAQGPVPLDLSGSK